MYRLQEMFSLLSDGENPYVQTPRQDSWRVFIEIDQDACTDCGMCLRANICPVSALFQPEDPWPREVRRILSNPFIEFAGSQVPGRGTEEMKTNDVKGTFLPGEVGIGIELVGPE